VRDRSSPARGLVAGSLANVGTILVDAWGAGELSTERLKFSTVGTRACIKMPRQNDSSVLPATDLPRISAG